MRALTDKRGRMDMLVPSILTLVLAAIILVFGLIMLDNLWDETDSGTEAYLAANETIVGIGDFADYVDLMVLAVVIAIIISLLLMVFSLRRVK
jgi:hypothetical protein